MKPSSPVLLFWTRKVNVCSSWRSFSKIIIIVSCVVWDEKIAAQNGFLFRFSSVPSPKRTLEEQLILRAHQCAWMVRGKVLIALWILTSILPVLCCTYLLCKLLCHCSLLTRQLHWDERGVTAWFLVGKDPSSQNHCCASAFTEVKRPAAD